MERLKFNTDFALAIFKEGYKAGQFSCPVNECRILVNGGNFTSLTDAQLEQLFYKTLATLIAEKSERLKKSDY